MTEVADTTLIPPDALNAAWRIYTGLTGAPDPPARKPRRRRRRGPDPDGERLRQLLAVMDTRRILSAKTIATLAGRGKGGRVRGELARLVALGLVRHVPGRRGYLRCEAPAERRAAS